ncbi:MAG: hypothetical protein LBM98_01435 [Oscillospiraceae bacterium]|nr:hypothetical protein [Oscillospiraceae bacterium]
MRYVGSIATKQSSAGSVTYGICGVYYWIASRLNAVVSYASRRFAMTDCLALCALFTAANFEYSC